MACQCGKPEGTKSGVPIQQHYWAGRCDRHGHTVAGVYACRWEVDRHRLGQVGVALFLAAHSQSHVLCSFRSFQFGALSLSSVRVVIGAQFSYSTEGLRVFGEARLREVAIASSGCSQGHQRSNIASASGKKVLSTCVNRHQQRTQGTPFIVSNGYQRSHRSCRASCASSWPLCAL